MKTTKLNELYIQELRDIYSAETQIVEAMPKVIEAAEAPDFRKMLQDHLRETQGQLLRLETIFHGLNERPTGNLCEATKGLVAEGEQAINEVEEGSVRDCALAGAAERIEHYEMAAYYGAVRIALALGRTSDANLLKESLNEELQASEKVAEFAESLLPVFKSTATMEASRAEARR